MDAHSHLRHSIKSFTQGYRPEHTSISHILICSYPAKLSTHGNRQGGNSLKLSKSMACTGPARLLAERLGPMGSQGLAGFGVHT